MPTETMAAAAPAGASERLRERARHPGIRLGALAAVVLALIAIYLLTAVPGSLSFAVRLRSLTVAAMVVVAVAVGVSSVVFHTVTSNRILTPSIMGFDAFYVLISTTVVFFLGGQGLLRGNPIVLWAIQVCVMVAGSAALFTWMFSGRRRSIHLMLLVGIVLGTFFRSFSEWMQRMLDPLDFQVLTDQLFASLTRPDKTLLVLSALLVLAACLVVIPLIPTLDVLSLGAPAAIGLGVPYRRVVLILFAAISVMVAAATALVGPILFFGLIVSNLAYSYIGSFRHRWTLPTAALLGVLCLIGGQVVLERVLSYGGSLSMIIEFTGGLFFLFLVLRKGAR